MGIASDEQIERALNTLQRTLNLTPTQSAEIRRLVESRRADFRSGREQTHAKFEQLMALLNQPNPDPATVGRAAIELKAAHDQARTRRADLESQLSNVLNASQRQVVNDLRAKADTFWALRRIGFIGRRGPGAFGQSTETSGSEEN